MLFNEFLLISGCKIYVFLFSIDFRKRGVLELKEISIVSLTQIVYW